MNLFVAALTVKAEPVTVSWSNLTSPMQEARILSEVWSNVVIDGCPLVARYVEPEQSSE